MNDRFHQLTNATTELVDQRTCWADGRWLAIGARCDHEQAFMPNMALAPNQSQEALEVITNNPGVLASNPAGLTLQVSIPY